MHISIVGVDRVPLDFCRSRLAAEWVIENSGLPWTILRTTQFHDLIRFLLAALARLPVMFVPDFSFQPIDVREVAGRLVEIATGAPAGHVPDTGDRKFATPVTWPGHTFTQSVVTVPSSAASAGGLSSSVAAVTEASPGRV